MVQAGGGLGLASDPGRIGARDLLHRHLALEPLVEGSVDGAHPTGADALQEPEAIHHYLADHSGLGFAARRVEPASWRNASCVCGRT